MDFGCKNRSVYDNGVPCVTEEKLNSADLSHNADLIESVLRCTVLTTDGTLILDRESGRRVSNNFCKG